MASSDQPLPDPQQLRAEARDWVYQRLAFLSAVVWVIGAAILMMTIVPVVALPQRYVAVAITVPLIPAALPWLFFGLLTNLRLRHLQRQRGRLDQ